MLAKNRSVEQNLGLGSSSPEFCLWWRYQKFGSSTDSKRSRRHRQACCESLALHGHVAPPVEFLSSRGRGRGRIHISIAGVADGL